MPLFEIGDGRARLVQPMQPQPSTFAAEVAAILTDHLAAVMSEPLFVVGVRGADDGRDDRPTVLALDAMGRPVVVDVVHVLDHQALLGALRRAGAAARLTGSDLARAYHPSDPARFGADFAAFRDARLPVARRSVDDGPRAVLVCADVAPEVADAVGFWRTRGERLDVLQVGMVRGQDGRRLLAVAPLARHESARRAVEPAGLRLVRTASGAEVDASLASSGTASVPASRPSATTSPTGSPVPRAASARNPSTPVAQDSPASSTAVPPSPTSPARVAPAFPASSVPLAPAAPAPVAPPPPAVPAAPSASVLPAVPLAPTPVTPPSPAVADSATPALAPAVGSPTPVPSPAVADSATPAPAPTPALAPAVASPTPAPSPAPDGAPRTPPARPTQPLAPPTRPAAPQGRPTTPATQRSATDRAVRPPTAAPEAYPELVELAEATSAPVQLVWLRLRRGQRLVAWLREDGLITIPSGATFDDPSDAAAAAASTEAEIDGWRSWRFGDDGPTLAEAVELVHEG